tara:strand:- start:275 stop:514 length:240 start_codon:yes stop_codon:yes gene_type:complete
LIVASSPAEAKNKAKSKWLIDSKKKHTNDIYTVKSFTDVDECEVIKNINDGEIELIPNCKHLEEKNIPDWFGYMRIDKK